LILPRFFRLSELREATAWYRRGGDSFQASNLFFEFRFLQGFKHLPLSFVASAHSIFRVRSVSLSLPTTRLYLVVAGSVSAAAAISSELLPNTLFQAAITPPLSLIDLYAFFRSGLRELTNLSECTSSLLHLLSFPAWSGEMEVPLTQGTYIGILRLKCANQRWRILLASPKRSISLCNHNDLTGGSKSIGDNLCNEGFLKRSMLDSFSGRSVTLGSKRLVVIGRSEGLYNSRSLRFYSSEGDGRNESENKHIPVADRGGSDNNKIQLGVMSKDFQSCNEHARLGEQDQKDWLNNEKIAMEHKKREPPFLTKREKFKNEFMRRIVPWEKITVSWETFPYHIHEHTKNLLEECASSHLKHKKLTAAFGSRLSSSTGRILLQSSPGTELYRERLVRALAREQKVSVLVLDSSVLAPFDFDQDYTSENESDDEECTSESDAEGDNDATNDEYASSSEAKSDVTEDEDIEVRAAEALKKLVPFNLEDFEKRVSGEPDSTSESSKQDDQTADKSGRPLRKGDRVKYVGPSVNIEADNRELISGQRGEVHEVHGESVTVILDIDNDTEDKGENTEKPEQDAKPLVCQIQVKDVERDLDTEVEDICIAMDALYEVLQSKEPLIVYFPDSSQWFWRAVPKSSRKEFISQVQEMFDQLSGSVLLICGQNKVETGSKEKEKFTMILPNFGRLAKLPLPLRQLTEGLKGSKRTEDDDIYKLFTNVMCIYPPKEDELLRTFNKQLEEDRRIVISRSNLIELHKVLEEHELSCVDLLHVNTDGVIITKHKAEKAVGWARNHYLSSCLLPSIDGHRLTVTKESLEIAIMRLKEHESTIKKPSHNLKNLAKDEYESNFISAVVPPGEIGVRFDDVGALEDVKKALNELVILPMKRPELFSRGNLLRPCKGILLFGPPGTGKTLMAKALATEAGANFISITGSTLTSKWFGDAEKLTKALFSFASKLAPVIIFVDEVDSLLGARGGAHEHEATRRMRNEFMAAWDGLRTKDSQRILILGATNRPFDLDDAVIRRLPRRIYVDLPDAENRKKILKIFLSQENLENDFEFDKLANVTEGYSGSDLKDANNSEASGLRPLKLDDFVQSKTKVGPSVAYDASSMNELRKWNEQYGEGGSRRKSPFGF
ncbi:hypothetical protein V2J09_011537, partial [Rumex salicifolius]